MDLVGDHRGMMRGGELVETGVLGICCFMAENESIVTRYGENGPTSLKNNSR